MVTMMNTEYNIKNKTYKQHDRYIVLTLCQFLVLLLFLFRDNSMKKDVLKWLRILNFKKICNNIKSVSA